MRDWFAGALKSKTMWVNAVVLVSTLVAMDEIKHFISPETLIKVQAILNILLRAFTWQPISEKVS